MGVCFNILVNNVIVKMIELFFFVGIKILRINIIVNINIFYFYVNVLYIDNLFFFVYVV